MNIIIILFSELRCTYYYQDCLSWWRFYVVPIFKECFHVLWYAKKVHLWLGPRGHQWAYPTSSPCLLSYWQGSWNSLFQDTTSAIYQNSANMWVCSWILFCFKVFFVYSVTLATSSQWHLRGQVTLPVFFPPLKKISAILEPFLINFHKKNSQLGFCFELLETYFKIWGKLTYLLRFCLYMVFLSIYFGLL